MKRRSTRDRACFRSGSRRRATRQSASRVGPRAVLRVRRVTDGQRPIAEVETTHFGAKQRSFQKCPETSMFVGAQVRAPGVPHTWCNAPIDLLGEAEYAERGWSVAAAPAPQSFAACSRVRSSSRKRLAVGWTLMNRGMSPPVAFAVAVIGGSADLSGRSHTDGRSSRPKARSVPHAGTGGVETRDSAGKLNSIAITIH